MSASLIGRLGSSAFRLSTTAMSMSLAGSCFSSESAPRPFHHGIRRRGGTIFSNRPFGVKLFQTIHHCNVDVARGLVLLFGIGTKALPSWDSKTRRNNLMDGLAVSRTAGPSGHTNSPHPSSREGHLSTAGWISSFLLSGMILNGLHAAAAACSLVHRNSVPSTCTMIGLLRILLTEIPRTSRARQREHATTRGRAP